MTILNDQKSVYVASCDHSDQGLVLLGRIPAHCSRLLYDFCEKEFGWQCGWEDSGFDQDEIVIMVDEQEDWSSMVWLGAKVRQRITDLASRPTPMFCDWRDARTTRHMNAMKERFHEDS